jgi:hypothetical protein
MNNRELPPLKGQVGLIKKLVNDYCKWSSSNDLSSLPIKKAYKIEDQQESSMIVSSARRAALSNILESKIMKKVAFDTRRIDQSTQGNPRQNLQYYNRSQQFIDAELDNRMAALAELVDPLDSIREKYGTQPEFFSSYVSQLYDLVYRALQVKKAELNVFRPQIDYLEQLLFARYRLTMEDLRSLDKKALEEKLLAKDENLLKRGAYLKKTKTLETPKQANNPVVMKDGNEGGMQQNLVNAIFGNNDFRREGEKTVERTITITIRDNVVE